MLLRRIREHATSHNWFAVAVDLLIVVLGVFLGMQVNNWNVAAINHRAEAAYLSQIRGDLRRIEGEVRDQIEFERFQGRLAGAVFDLIEHDRTPDRGSRINMGLSQLTMRRTLRTESPTFVDLQSSGNLEVISDPVLRADIINYFFQRSRLEAAIDKNNGYFVDEGLLAFMRNQAIPARAWDDKLMSLHRPDPARLIGSFQDEIYAGAMFRIQSASLGRAPNAPFWAPVVTQLAWRAHVSAANASLAQRLLEATSSLQMRVARRVDGARR